MTLLLERAYSRRNIQTPRQTHGSTILALTVLSRVERNAVSLSCLMLPRPTALLLQESGDPSSFNALLSMPVSSHIITHLWQGPKARDFERWTSRSHGRPEHCNLRYYYLPGLDRTGVEPSLESSKVSSLHVDVVGGRRPKYLFDGSASD